PSSSRWRCAAIAPAASAAVESPAPGTAPRRRRTAAREAVGIAVTLARLAPPCKYRSLRPPKCGKEPADDVDPAERRRARVLDHGPGPRRDSRRDARAARRRRGPRRDALLRRQPRHGVAGLHRPRSAERIRADAGAVPGGRFPRAGEIRLRERRTCRRGARGAAGADRVLPASAPDALRR